MAPKRIKCSSISSNIVTSRKVFQTSIDDLPREILIEIFKHYVRTEGIVKLMDVISKVCEHWKSVAKHYDLWLAVDCRLKKSVLLRLCRRDQLRRTEKLCLSHIARELSLDDTEEIFGKCPNLKDVDISCSQKGRNVLSVIADYCPKVERLNFQHASGTISYQNITPVLKSCSSNITYLNFSNNKITVMYPLLVAIANFCPNLKELHLASMHGTQFNFPIAKFGVGCPNLEILEIEEFTYSNTNCKDFLGFKQLHTLLSGVGASIGPEDKDIALMLRGSPNLRVLDLRGCRVSTTVLLGLPALNLETLFISRSSAVVARNFSHVILKWKHSLKNIDLSKCTDEDSLSDSILSLANNGINTTLAEIDLSGTLVREIEIMFLVNKCPNLRYMNLESCRNLQRGNKRIYHTRKQIKAMFSKT